MPSIIDTVKRALGGLTEIGLLLVGVGVVLQILFGAGQNAFFPQVIQNLVDVIEVVGENGLFGLIALAIIIWIFYKRVL